MKIIRIKGLAAFIAALALIFGTWFLFIDGAIRSLIEKGGTALVGAKVDLQKADLSLSPLGLTLTGLDVTDPDKPMENMVHVDKISFLMDFGNLLLNKIIVDEMSIDGVKTGTPRKSSGAIEKKKEKKEKEVKTETASGEFALPSLAVPDIKEILGKEKLESIEKIEALKADLEQKKAAWELKLKSLPDDKKIDQYKKRIKVIEKGLKGKGAEILKAVNDASALQKDIDSDLKNLKSARKALEADLKTIEKDLKGIEKLPDHDLRRLQAKYSLSSAGLGNFSRLLFGAKIAEWTELLIAWYGKLEPSLREMAREEKSVKEDKAPVRAGGRDIKFREYTPRPDFLVKTARVTLDIPAGALKGEVKNITDNQPLIALPTTLSFTGQKLKGLDSAEIRGEINRLDPKNPFEKGSIETKGYKLKDVVLSSNKDFPVEMKTARMDGNITFVHKKRRFNADLEGNFRETLFSGEAAKKGGSEITLLLLSALSDIRTFNVKGSVKGDEKGYDMKLSSDIDRVMKKAVGKKVQEESRRFAENLKKSIAEKIEKPLGDLKKGSGDLGDMDKLLAGNLRDLENQLKSSKKLSPKGLKGLNFKF